MGKTHLIIDCDTKYTAQFQGPISESRNFGNPIATAIAQSECLCGELRALDQGKILDRMIFVAQRSLCRAISEFVIHYHFERSHQGIDNRLIQPELSPLVV